MLAIDPLHHFVAAQRYLADPSPTALRQFRASIGGEYPDQVIIELAIDAVRRGARDDALGILTAGSGPIARAWSAYLGHDATPVHGAAPLDLVFPYRPETIPVLQWVTEQNPDWSWRYLLALNLWACDRPEEAAAILESLDAIDYGPALVARGLLLEAVRHLDPTPDLRRAVARDPADRLLRVTLVRKLQERSDWQGALVVADSGRQRFPTDFNLDLLAVNSLVHLGRGSEAATLLDRTHVLPSENARDSHRLYVQAHTIAALDAIDARRLATARRHLEAALEWPEHLGQGKPYHAEERLTRYLLGVTAAREGDTTAARRQWEAAANATGATTPALVLVSALARARLGRGPAPVAPTTTSDDLDRRLVLRAMELDR
jgi:tetratricopeptide (TPR) repeat protein